MVCLWIGRDATERIYYTICRLSKSCQNEAEVKSNYIVNWEEQLECVCSLFGLYLRFPLFDRYHIIFWLFSRCSNLWLNEIVFVRHVTGFWMEPCEVGVCHSAYLLGICSSPSQFVVCNIYCNGIYAFIRNLSFCKITLNIIGLWKHRIKVRLLKTM